MRKAAARLARRCWIAPVPISVVVLLSLAPLARAQPTAPVDLAAPPQGLGFGGSPVAS